jgi:hypothetical protein
MSILVALPAMLSSWRRLCVNCAASKLGSSVSIAAIARASAACLEAVQLSRDRFDWFSACVPFKYCCTCQVSTCQQYYQFPWGVNRRVSILEGFRVFPSRVIVRFGRRGAYVPSKNRVILLCRPRARSIVILAPSRPGFERSMTTVTRAPLHQTAFQERAVEMTGAATWHIHYTTVRTAVHSQYQSGSGTFLT